MKKIILVLSTIIFGTFQHLSAQDSLNRSLARVLTDYYQVKNDLVKDNANATALSAAKFTESLNKVEKGLINEELKATLLKDASGISQSKKIEVQREKFAALSSNMIALIKVAKLSDQPVYEEYCPMKKASWLSSEKAVKNPYYGSSMLTCGSVKATY